MNSTRARLREATRQRVLTTAERLFQERGFTATTIRDIAEAAEVSVGTVMSVGDKNALLVQVFDSLIAAGHALRAPAVPDDRPCAERLLELVQPFVSLFESRQELARSYASILVAGGHSSTLFSQLASLLVDEIRSAITLHGCTPPEAAAATADAIYFAYVGTLFTWSAREPTDERELSDSLRATFAAVCACKE